MSGAVLIVGLGNPGPEYADTRHNLGYRVIERLCARADTRLRPLKGVRAFTAEGRDADTRLLFAQPTTYMNESGEAVGALARWAKTGAEAIVVVHDDLDLPLGTVRVKRGGGDGGHNGLGSVTRAIGREYARVRIGIGRPAGSKDPADWVLEPFAKKDLDEVAIAIEEAADAVLGVVREGVEATQNRLHGAQAPQRKARKVRKQVDVDAPIEEVFAAWSTTEGAVTFFAPAARIAAEPGGAYELYFDPTAPRGLRGTEGCTVESVDPPRRITFTWNNPPSLPAIRSDLTTVAVALRSTGADRTRVTLTQTGFGDGEHWDESVRYFERAWDIVLGHLQQRFADGPIDWGER